jgi:hypothetical protein
MKTVLFRVITQWGVVISYQRFGAPYWYHAQGKEYKN